MKRNLFYLLCPALFLLYSKAGLTAVPALHTGMREMVVTSQYLATEIGFNVLKQGGNAIDAAVAIGYALAVVEPCCGNLGGGGFMLIHLASGQNTVLNFRERAPIAIYPEKIYFDSAGNPLLEKINHGFTAVAIPGTVMGLNTALSKYGTWPLTKLLAPAIRLADNGYRLSRGDIKLYQSGLRYFYQDPEATRLFLNNGQPYQVGDRFKQHELANTLRRIAKKGTAAIYQGQIAEAIVTASQKHGYTITRKDFKSYFVEWLTPITCQYRGFTVISVPPPSSGGITLCEMLNVLEFYPLSFLGFHTAMSVHYTTEVMRYAFADRNQFLGDPDFVKNPITELLSRRHAEMIRAQVRPYRAGDSTMIGLNYGLTHEKMQTTHYVVLDKFGNAVSVTYTLNGYFGAKVIAPGTGFFLNDTMADFSLRPNTPNMFQLVESKNNAIGPGKRPLSAMTPTIVMNKGKVYMILGAAGGPTIITQVLAMIQNVIDYGMSIQAAIDAPRYHMQWQPDVIFLEPFVFSSDILTKLGFMGYRFREGSPFLTDLWGRSEAILRDPRTGIIYGASDHRSSTGMALGN